MSQEKERIDGGPAFPTTKVNPDIVPKPAVIPDRPGMSLRAYAAIKLRVPESGIDWLDGMIERSRRDDLAGQALQGLVATNEGYVAAEDKIANWSYQLADAARKESSHESLS